MASEAHREGRTEAEPGSYIASFGCCGSIALILVW